MVHGYVSPYLSVLLLLFIFQFAHMGPYRQSCRGALVSLTGISHGALDKVALIICGILPVSRCL